jgi:hypothetical protein
VRALPALDHQSGSKKAVLARRLLNGLLIGALTQFDCTALIAA